MNNEVKFKAIGLMADRNLDVRLSNTLTECRTVKAGSIVSFGVDAGTGHLIRKQMLGAGDNTHIVVCLIIDAAQLAEIEKELAAKDRPKELKTGIELIAEERQRQIDVEGWTPEHDDQHTGEELAQAAACYAYPPQNAYPSRLEDWPFDPEWFKTGPRLGELIKAGALIVAEIDRLQRKAAKEGGKK